MVVVPVSAAGSVPELARARVQASVWVWVSAWAEREAQAVAAEEAYRIAG